MKKLVNHYVGIVLLLLLVSNYFSSCSLSPWKKKQFSSYEELGNAFHGTNYDDVVKEFGKPTYKFLDVIKQTITYKWQGIGVIGHPDAYLRFSAMEYITNFFKGYEFIAVEEYEGYSAPGNDNTYNIE
jgi:hypothetical protein